MGEHRERAPKGETAAVFRLAVKLGFTAFGGPVAHIAMLQDEVVERRRWMTAQHFLALLGLTNFLPGPNSTEMMMHVGRERAGVRGLVASGIGFVVPAAAITLALAIAYERYGSTPTGEHLLYGIQPVVIAVILQAVWRLQRIAVTGPLDIVAITAIALLYVLGLPELPLLFLGGLAVLIIREGRVRWQSEGFGVLIPLFLILPTIDAHSQASTPYSAARLFWSFLKIGAVLYGSGYVLIALLQGTFVEDIGWLTDQQLLDAVAAGQITPGPVFTTATFVGYLVGGVSGAVLATVAVFLPAFVYVAMANPLLGWIQRHEFFSRLLDGVSLAAIGLMLGVGWSLAAEAIVDIPTGVIAAVAAALLLVSSTGAPVLIFAGGIAGLAIKSL